MDTDFDDFKRQGGGTPESAELSLHAGLQIMCASTNHRALHTLELNSAGLVRVLLNVFDRIQYSNDLAGKQDGVLAKQGWKYGFHVSSDGDRGTTEEVLVSGVRGLGSFGVL